MAARRTTGVTTWGALEAFEGPVLLVINSAFGDAERAGAVLDALNGRARADGLHVLAHPEWAGWLESRGIPPDRMLLSIARVSGKPVEVNHFLEASEALLWTVPKTFQAIIGSTPHNQYNEEVQTVFEQRVSVLVGDGVFLAHCLPLPYVYVLDAAALVHRFGREERVHAYQSHAHRLVDDLHRLWQSRGRPAVDDDDRYDATLAIVEQHLGRDVVTFDEASPIVIPVRHADGAAECARVLRHLREVLHARDVLLAERSEAVEVRDRLLEQMHRDTWSARIRRLMGRGD